MNTFINKIPQISIQKVTKQDVNDWFSILYESLEKTYSHYTAANEMIKNYNTEKIKENFLRELNSQNSNAEHYMLKLNGLSVGILQIGKPTKYFNNNFYKDEKSKVGIIKYLYIKNDYQGHGIGGQAISFAENRLKKLRYDKSSIWIETKNSQAINFCFTHGYNKSKYSEENISNNSIVVEKSLKTSASNFDIEEIGNSAL